MNPKHGFVLLMVLCLPATLLAGPDGAGAGDLFAKLKSLQGDWSGEAEARHTFRVSAAGTVVMETMFPGTDHEMINMYHVDGDDLVLTHYCAMGNQPRMRLDRAASSTDRLVFAFDGGTNFDPSTDAHIHSAVLTLTDGGLTSEWTSWNEGKLADTMKFDLARE